LLQIDDQERRFTKASPMRAGGRIGATSRY